VTVAALVRRYFFLVFLLLTLMDLASAYAADWPPPTAAQMKMTSDAKAPGADAVYLYREEIVDDKVHIHRVTAEIKILTEKGKQEYSDIAIPYEAGMSSIGAIEGQTIQSDGTVVGFKGQPHNKEVLKQGDKKIMETVFSMPDVQVGSIVEYQWELRYDDEYFMPPQWLIQRSIYVHKAHYHFVPVDMATAPEIMVTDAMGKASPANQLLYYQNLPAGDKVTYALDGYNLVVQDIPALPDEPDSPPLGSYAYQVLFYYSPAYTGTQFWMTEGREWSKDVDRFAKTSGAIRAAEEQITAGATTDGEKLEKIYAAMMTLENTDFTRARSAEENKAEGIHVKTAADIWKAKRGTGNEITRLFIALVRAAGMNAYDMIVPARDTTVLNTGYLYWGQLTDEVAIVPVNGKHLYFDPGERYCEFGKLDWEHVRMTGIRQSAKGLEMGTTPGAVYQDNTILRTAYLELGATGTVSGQIRLTLSGAPALRWRQDALRTDAEQTKKDFTRALQAEVPAGVQVTVTHFLGLTDPTTALMAVATVSGNAGTAAGKLAFVAGQFFEARQKPKFAAQTRKAPIDLHYPYLAQDQVHWTLDGGLTVKSLPKNAVVPYLPYAEYKANYTGTGNQLDTVRLMAVGNAEYKATDYPALRQFFQTASAQDQQQVVLAR
jgi:hypothetical protein